MINIKQNISKYGNVLGFFFLFIFLLSLSSRICSREMHRIRNPKIWGPLSYKACLHTSIILSLGKSYPWKGVTEAVRDELVQPSQLHHKKHKPTAVPLHGVLKDLSCQSILLALEFTTFSRATMNWFWQTIFAPQIHISCSVFQEADLYRLHQLGLLSFGFQLSLTD